jgi:hypothetical protein
MVGGPARWPRAEKETLGDVTKLAAVMLKVAHSIRLLTPLQLHSASSPESQNEKGAD